MSQSRISWFSLQCWIVLGCWLLAGCPASQAVYCDPLWCPAGAICTVGGCAWPGEVAACADRGEGETCSLDDAALATCAGGACRAIVCGDSRRVGPEVCDDGNLESGDGCAADCRSLETCGNGIVDRAIGEECDDANRDDGDACHGNCMVPRCGDGVVDGLSGESCDTGSDNSNMPDAACRPNCQPQRCGDGARDTGEICDDGNLLSGDGCSGDCLSNETCGNGYVDIARGEQCDDRLPLGLSEDGCASRCLVELLT